MSIKEQTEVEQMKAPTVSVPVNLVRLSKVGQRPDILDYLVQLWDRRSFIFFDARARVQSGNDQTKLGAAWLVLTPILTGLSFYLIFGVLLGTSRGIENFIGYLIIGVFTFQMTSRSVLNGAKSLTSNTSMIRAFQFPRAALPIALNVRELLSNIPVTIVMLLFVILTAPAEEITWRWLLIVPAILLQFLFNLGLGMLLAPAILKIPDLSKLLSFLMQFWMYGSAVFFAETRFDAYPVIRTILDYNPAFQVIKIIRDSVLYDTTPSWRAWAVVGVWALGSAAAGLVVFWRGEESYGRV
ncbi:teichoic acid transport system permease protein [Arthrobacter sp. V4I6]|uniref:ABC transporter permease n=1 Tax=unclassified Arthrobacter TaxID=235627 RepID=UPI0027894935|nr:MULTISPECIES: ABC transporter permease [unclassified Arthrobacter]MDQ0820475.1 teichoic acid transport system permease protein [Arthrobacter sp. V1I7]MDQ0854656.1 teichoic acid transport system permease protein [Arthrobacter sp. V4I6]